MNVFKALKFMAVAEAMQAMSKDRSTKVGAVALDDDYNILSVGYNGFPKKVRDDIDERHERPVKYSFTCHAEANVVSQAAYKGASLRGSTILVTSLFPCAGCTGQMIQAGVKRIITSDPDVANNPMWLEQAVISKTMLREAEVEIIYAKPNGYGVWEIDGSKVSQNGQNT